MSEPPRFELIGMQPPSEVREEVELLPEVYHALTDGVPGELFAPLYRAAETPTVLRVVPGRDLIQFGGSGLGHAICVDPRTGQVVEVLDTHGTTASDSTSPTFVNSSLPLFNRTVEAVDARFPFYSSDDEYETREAVADELAEIIRGIDPPAIVPDRFWSTFVDDVAIGDYADED